MALILDRSRKVSCHHCEALVINNTPAHEYGCIYNTFIPDEHGHLIGARLFQCRECGQNYLNITDALVCCIERPEELFEMHKTSIDA